MFYFFSHFLALLSGGCDLCNKVVISHCTFPGLQKGMVYPSLIVSDPKTLPPFLVYSTMWLVQFDICVPVYMISLFILSAVFGCGRCNLVTLLRLHLPRPVTVNSLFITCIDFDLHFSPLNFLLHLNCMYHYCMA